MLPRVVVAAVLAACTLSILQARGQATPPAPVFRSAADVVEVDVQVTDTTGRPIADLVSGDFTLLVGGGARPIANVDLVSHADAPARAPAAVPAEDLAIAAASYSSNAGTLPGRLFVIVVDQGNMTKGGGRERRRAIGSGRPPRAVILGLRVPGTP